MKSTERDTLCLTELSHHAKHFLGTRNVSQLCRTSIFQQVSERLRPLSSPELVHFDNCANRCGEEVVGAEKLVSVLLVYAACLPRSRRCFCWRYSCFSAPTTSSVQRFALLTKWTSSGLEQGRNLSKTC